MLKPACTNALSKLLMSHPPLLCMTDTRLSMGIMATQCKRHPQDAEVNLTSLSAKMVRDFRTLCILDKRIVLRPQMNKLFELYHHASALLLLFVSIQQNHACKCYSTQQRANSEHHL